QVVEPLALVLVIAGVVSFATGVAFWHSYPSTLRQRGIGWDPTDEDKRDVASISPSRRANNRGRSAFSVRRSTRSANGRPPGSRSSRPASSSRPIDPLARSTQHVGCCGTELGQCAAQIIIVAHPESPGSLRRAPHAL